MPANNILAELFEAQAERARLDEVTVKDLAQAIHPSKLPHRDYAPLIKMVNYRGMRGDTMKFHVPNRFNGWNSYLRFKDWGTVVSDTTIKPLEGARLLLSTGNVAVHCNCPAYRFWGYQYILTQIDAAIVPEERYPHVRNPRLLNVACKHLRRVIPVALFYSGTLSQQIARQRQRKGWK